MALIETESSAASTTDHTPAHQRPGFEISFTRPKSAGNGIWSLAAALGVAMMIGVCLVGAPTALTKYQAARTPPQRPPPVGSVGSRFRRNRKNADGMTELASEVNELYGPPTAKSRPVGSRLFVRNKKKAARSEVKMARSEVDAMKAAVSSRPLEIYEVIKTLQRDIPRIFRRQPHWELFSEDFKIVDPSGAKLEGLWVNKMLWDLLRNLRNSFRMTDSMKIYFFHQGRDEEEPLGLDSLHGVELHGPLLAFGAKLKLRLQQKKVKKADRFPIIIDADLGIHVDKENKIDEIRILSWKMNGQQLQGWPAIDWDKEMAKNLAMVEEWTSELPPIEPQPATSIA